MSEITTSYVHTGEGPNPLTEEVWRYVPGYEGQYEVSSFGRLRGWLDSHRNRKPTPHPINGFILSGKGYHYAALCYSGCEKNFGVHTLVLRSFVGIRPLNYHGAHWDGNKLNNCLNNLRWATPSDNAIDKRRHGTSLLGKRGRNFLLSDDQVRRMRELYATGRYNQSILGSMFGVSRHVCGFVVRGQTYTDVI